MSVNKHTKMDIKKKESINHLKITLEVASSLNCSGIATKKFTRFSYF